MIVDIWLTLNDYHTYYSSILAVSTVMVADAIVLAVLKSWLSSYALHIIQEDGASALAK